LVVESKDGFGDILLAEFLDARIYGHSEFAVEDAWAVLAIDIDIVFAETGVDAIDYGFEILVDQHGGCAEDDEVEIEGGDGIVEVRFSEDEVEEALAFSEPEAEGGSLGRIDPADFEPEPGRGWAGFARD
jgi:hypothetical protein